MSRLSKTIHKFKKIRRDQIRLMREEAETLPAGRERCSLLIRADALENAAKIVDAFRVGKGTFD